MSGHTSVKLEYTAPEQEKVEIKRDNTLPDVMEPPLTRFSRPKQEKKRDSKIAGNIPSIEEPRKEGCDCTIF